MKKQITEPDFIGGQGALTNDEEIALTKYFADKKSKATSNIVVKQTSIKRQIATQ